MAEVGNKRFAESAVRQLWGGSEVLIVTYKNVTETLSQGAHPGSYNGQDAYNDMLVTENERTDSNGICTGERRNHAGGGVQH